MGTCLSYPAAPLVSCPCQLLPLGPCAGRCACLCFGAGEPLLAGKAAEWDSLSGAPWGIPVARIAGQLFPELKSQAGQRPVLPFEHLLPILEQQEAPAPTSLGMSEQQVSV